jgi:pyrimidine deaminase RibD-like protein
MQSAESSETQGDSVGNNHDVHFEYLRQALDLARKSPPKTTNYRVGALLIDSKTDTILATGYTLECEGNTHAEQSCLIKIAEEYGTPEERLAEILPESTVLYTTVEPCFKRLSGNMPCVERILRLRNNIKTVYVGVIEPEKFVGQNSGIKQLEEAGIEVILVKGMEDEILKVATAGHKS